MSVATPKNLSHSYPAVAGSVPIGRRAIARYAQELGATAEELDEIRLAVSEAMTNAVLHAYRGNGSGHVHVNAALASGELWVLISDDGRGLQTGTESPGLGVGLALICEVTDSCAIVKRASGGTEVRMRFSLESAPLAEEDEAQSSSSSATIPASPIFSTTR
jgi:stage II sporulation protein AB (anti-sigma F factor)